MNKYEEVNQILESKGFKVVRHYNLSDEQKKIFREQIKQNEQYKKDLQEAINLNTVEAFEKLQKKYNVKFKLPL